MKETNENCRAGVTARRAPSRDAERNDKSHHLNCVMNFPGDLSQCKEGERGKVGNSARILQRGCGQR